jgi:cytochrome c oxidase assembly factor CtaG
MVLANAHTAHALNWDWEPSILLGLALLISGYALAVGPLRRKFRWSEPVALWRQLAFYAGCLAVFVALVSPLDNLSDEYLFSAHMGQHMLLQFVAPPLWLLGTPAWLVERLIPAGRGRRAVGAITHPVTAFAIFYLTMWAWHWPPAYDLALEHERVHIVEHLLFMATAVIGWWPVLGRVQFVSMPLGDLGRVLYLIASMFPCTALAALITLSPSVLYTFYGTAPQQWGLAPLVDQQIGGLIMWLPGDMIFLLALIIVFSRWLNQPPSSLAVTPGSLKTYSE